MPPIRRRRSIRRARSRTRGTSRTSRRTASRHSSADENHFSTNEMQGLPGVSLGSDNVFEDDTMDSKPDGGVSTGRSPNVNQEKYQLVDTDGTPIPWASDIGSGLPANPALTVTQEQQSGQAQVELPFRKHVPRFDHEQFTMIDTDGTPIPWSTDITGPELRQKEQTNEEKTAAYFKHCEDFDRDLSTPRQNPPLKFNQQQYVLIDSDGTPIPWVTDDDSDTPEAAQAEGNLTPSRSRRGSFRGRLSRRGTRIPWIGRIRKRRALSAPQPFFSRGISLRGRGATRWPRSRSVERGAQPPNWSRYQRYHPIYDSEYQGRLDESIVNETDEPSQSFVSDSYSSTLEDSYEMQKQLELKRHAVISAPEEQAHWKAQEAFTHPFGVRPPLSAPPQLQQPPSSIQQQMYNQSDFVKVIPQELYDAQKAGQVNASGIIQAVSERCDLTTPLEVLSRNTVRIEPDKGRIWLNTASFIYSADSRIVVNGCRDLDALFQGVAGFDAKSIEAGLTDNRSLSGSQIIAVRDNVIKVERLILFGNLKGAIEVVTLEDRTIKEVGPGEIKPSYFRDFIIHPSSKLTVSFAYHFERQKNGNIVFDEFISCASFQDVGARPTELLSANKQRFNFPFEFKCPIRIGESVRVGQINIEMKRKVEIGNGSPNDLKTLFDTNQLVTCELTELWQHKPGGPELSPNLNRYGGLSDFGSRGTLSSPSNSTDYVLAKEPSLTKVRQMFSPHHPSWTSSGRSEYVLAREGLPSPVGSSSTGSAIWVEAKAHTPLSSSSIESENWMQAKVHTPVQHYFIPASPIGYKHGSSLASQQVEAGAVKEAKYTATPMTDTTQVPTISAPTNGLSVKSQEGAFAPTLTSTPIKEAPAQPSATSEKNKPSTTIHKTASQRSP